MNKSLTLASGNSVTRIFHPQHLTRWLYPVVVGLILFTWVTYMFLTQSWGVLADHWAIALTMSIGSFVAGSTAEGGGAVAFPVLTKALGIPSDDARTFGLMIQSFGMTMAGLVIVLRRIPVLYGVIVWVSLGGIIGQVIGTYWLVIPQPFPRILFTLVAGTFGLMLLICRLWLRWTPNLNLPESSPHQLPIFLTASIAGGIFAAHVGTGLDMLTFIVLTLGFGVHEKISTPTTVIIMGLNSIAGFYLHGVVSQDIGVVWDYWLAAVPIVIIGAPLGAIAASKMNRDALIALLLTLISLEVVSTFLLIPFSMTRLLITAVAAAGCILCFGGLLWYKNRYVDR
jgi:uncharacterized membrane protein YfcA